MRTGGRVLLLYGGFAVVIAVVYRLVASYEAAGTLLLGSMGVACVALAAYLLVRNRRRPETDEDVGTTELGPFPLATAWPLILAIASALIALGLIYGSGVWALGLVAFGLGVIGLVRESV